MMPLICRRFQPLLVVAGVFLVQFGTLGVIIGVVAICTGIGGTIWDIQLANAAEADKDIDLELY